MPPNAELRNRAGQSSESQKAAVLKEVKTSQLLGNEIMIDGVIYDLDSFQHPGGEVVKVFGGSDVTVQYKMIHHHHTAKHLQKMKVVGKVTDYKPHYKFDTPFERELKEEVFKVVKRGKEYGTPGYFARAAFYISLLVSCQFAFVYYGSSVPLALLFGVAQAWIGLNVQHDANHGAASKKSWVNDLLGFGADFIGGSKYTWIEQHWTHHAYTNHQTYDPDAFSAEPFVLFNDYPLGNPARKFYHRFQALFFLPALSFYWLSSVFNPQILTLQHAGAKAVGQKFDNEYIHSRRKFGITLRALYIMANVVTPFLHHGLCWAPLLHIWIMSTAESLMLATLFSLSHNFETVDRDPTRQFRETGQPVCWFKSQVETSSTYGDWLAGWITGGLNFQIEHHLFPRMSSAWYPTIAPVVRRVCAKHGVKYQYYPTALHNLMATFTYIHRSGTGAHWERDPLSGK